MRDKPGKSIQLSRRKMLKGILGAAAAVPFSRWASAAFAASSEPQFAAKVYHRPLILPMTTSVFWKNWRKQIFSTSGNRPTPTPAWSKTDARLADRTRRLWPASPPPVSGSRRCASGTNADTSHSRRRAIARSPPCAFCGRSCTTQRGFFFHWANINTGERLWESEVSSIDTAILLCGVLTCRAVLRAPLRNQPTWRRTSSTAWTGLAFRRHAPCCRTAGRPKPASCAIAGTVYSELMMLYLLGLGSSTYPLPPGFLGRLEADHCSSTTASNTSVRSRRSSCISTRRPGSISAASATSTPTIFRIPFWPPRPTARFCLDLAKQFPDYSEDLWGITASDSHQGLRRFGAARPKRAPSTERSRPARRPARCRFLPQQVMRVLRTIQLRYGTDLEPLRICGRFQSADQLV